MNTDKTAIKILEHLTAKFPTATIKPCPEYKYYDEGANHLVFEIDREHYIGVANFVWSDNDFRGFLEQFEGDFYPYIAVKEIMPDLLPAKIGDFVLIYRDGVPDDNCDIGIVGSVNTEEDGSVSYGCRYILPVINSRWEEQRTREEWHLSSEDYGGYQTASEKTG